MLCEFVDGSKTAIEMAAVSNATGVLPDKRGMHGAHSTVRTLKEVFVTKQDGGVLERSGVVDFAIGVHPGVFLIVKTDNKLIMEGMAQRDMGPGPYYTLFRPFHLCSVEVPLTVAKAVFYGESSGHPDKRLHSECIAIATKDLKAGEVLDGIGEYCYRGSVEVAEVARTERLLPLGIAKGCRLFRDVRGFGEGGCREPCQGHQGNLRLRPRRRRDPGFIRLVPPLSRRPRDGLSIPAAGSSML